MRRNIEKLKDFRLRGLGDWKKEVLKKNFEIL